MTSTTTDFSRRLELTYPIIQAPMAGGGDTPALAAAVCNAGGLGFVGCAYSAPETIRQLADAVRALTTRPFGINLFAPVASEPSSGNVTAAIARVAPYYRELGLEPPQLPPAAGDTFEQRLAAVLDSGASAFSFTLGLLPPEAMRAAKQRMVVVGTATTVDEALQLEQAGADAVIAQGAEAGGHRGTFDDGEEIIRFRDRLPALLPADPRKWLQ